MTTIDPVSLAEIENRLNELRSAVYLRTGNAAEATVVQEELPPFAWPIPERTYWHKDGLDDDSSYDPDYGANLEQVPTLGGANLISSYVQGGGHAPAIDIDVPCRLVPSSTPGHFHLYIDKVITWPEYMGVLKSLAAAGIVEQAYVDHSLNCGHTLLRPEGHYKPGATPMVATGDSGVIPALRFQNQHLRDLVSSEKARADNAITELRTQSLRMQQEVNAREEAERQLRQLRADMTVGQDHLTWG